MRTLGGILLLAIAFQSGDPAPAFQSGQRPAQNPGLWRDVTMLGRAAAVEAGQRVINRYRTVALDQSILNGLLGRAEREFTDAARTSDVLLELPWPDGETRLFRIEESPIMAPELAARFPEIRTYRGQGVDDPTASLRLDWTSAGLHASVLSAEGTVYIDPYAPGDTQNYMAYFRKDYGRLDGQSFQCGVTGQQISGFTTSAHQGIAQVPNGAQLRTYRLAVAATAEYTAARGGTIPSAMSGIVTTMNRVNGIYERDLAIRMTLVANNSSIVYTNSATDPYTNGSVSTMLCQNARTLDTTIGSANYDIGHVFGTGTGGTANFAIVCDSSNACGSPSGSSKARGATALNAPVGDAFDVDFVAHEIGHQFGAEHTFNGTTSSCSGGTRNAPTAYEPGSGSTVMGYAGVCGVEDLQSHSSDYFHASSQSEIISFVTNASTGGSCAVPTATGNTPPTVSAGPSYAIPKSTPFTLTAVGNDADGDSLTYAWEEYDLGLASPPSTDSAGARPIFRSFPPTASPSRSFPKLSDILNNFATFGESMATITRSMTFRVTARDNRAGGGGTASADTTVNVRADMGPFAVTTPNTAVSWPGNSTQTVNWSVANTTAAPVSTANVRILLSTDGGSTFPTVLAASTPNDGSEPVVMPNIFPTNLARIKVEAVGNIYFDITNSNFTISASPIFGNAVYDSTLMVPACGPGNECDSGVLLNGSGNLSGGPEPNQPNNLYAGCPDRSLGSYHFSETVDRIRVFTANGPLVPGNTVTVETTVWAFSTGDRLDVYYTADVVTPAWTLIATLTPPAGGAQVLTTSYVLPVGTRQAVRAHFRAGTGAAPCTAGSFDESDDLAFTPVRAPVVTLDGNDSGDAFIYKSTTGSWRRETSQGGGGFTGVNGGWAPGWSVQPAQFNSDLLTDLFVFSTTTGQWFKMLNNGSGFTAQSDGGWWPGWQRHVMDLDGDGVSDLFLYNPDTGEWFKCISTPTGFIYHQGGWSPGWNLYPWRSNGDARDDLFLINPTTGQWVWVQSESGGVFTYPVWGAWAPGWNIYPADFNGDGRGDLLLHNPTIGQYYVATNTVAGFSYEFGSWSLGWTPYIVDFDGNHVADLFLYNTSGQWFELLSDGFSHFTFVGTGGWSPNWEIYPTDFNADGRTDLLLYSPTTGQYFQAWNFNVGAFSYFSGGWDTGVTIIVGKPVR